jgi:hypothetical protein
MLVELVAELKDRCGEKSVSFGLVKSPDTKEMKLHITSMISSQAKAAKHNATKDAMALLVFKLNTANEALLRAVNDVEREKYTRIIEKLQRKMDKHLLEDSDEEPNYDDNTCFSSFEDRLNSATDLLVV